MQGETDLATLLNSIKPELQEGEWVICTIREFAEVPQDSVVCFIREQEGITVILPKAVANALGLSYHFVASWITLTVHSSLEAVGLTAAFSTALAGAGISCNVVAGFYHDHLFVPVKDRELALGVLIGLSG